MIVSVENRIREVSKVVQANSDAAGQSAAISNELSEQSQTLSQLISQFRIEYGAAAGGDSADRYFEHLTDHQQVTGQTVEIHQGIHRRIILAGNAPERVAGLDSVFYV